MPGSRTGSQRRRRRRWREAVWGVLGMYRTSLSLGDVQADHDVGDFHSDHCAKFNKELGSTHVGYWEER